MDGGKQLRLRRAATCAACNLALPVGDQAYWYRTERVVRCLACATPDPAPRAAGASAQTEYERRHAKDEERTRRNLPRTMLVLAIAPFFGYFSAQVVSDLINTQTDSMTSSLTDGAAESSAPISDDTSHTYGLYAAGFATVSVATAVFGRRQSTEAWRIGAEGERRTAKALDKLPPSYRVLHDLPMPRSRANIDHVVVGPTGVFTIETKNYKHGVKIKGGNVYSAGRKLDGAVAQAKKQTDAVAVTTGASVTPIVCVHGEGVSVDWFQKPVIDGVRFCSGRALAKTITKRTAVLSAEAIEELAGRLAPH